MIRLTVIIENLKELGKFGRYLSLSTVEVAAIVALLNKAGVVSIFRVLRNSVRLHYKLLSKAFIVIGVFLFSVLIIALKFGIEPSDITRDYSGVYHHEPWVGVISYLGIFLWCAALAVCGFTWRILRKIKTKEKYSVFFFWSGLITLILTLDDQFMLHEIVLPEYVGISEKLFYLFYLALITLYSFKFLTILLNQNVALIFLAYLLFAVSMTFDLFFEGVPFDTYIEDSMKFTGITLWAIYFIKSAYGELQTVITPDK
jgi:hypothetical protein